MRCAILAAILPFLASTEIVAESVETQYGLVSGMAAGHESIVVFKGIPYARPPVGVLRWRPPEPPVAWKGIRTCDAFGATSLQRKLFRGKDQSEDCLYLNVWAPRASSQQKRPVMIWIHGGGFTTGSGHQAAYDGTELARRGVVLVSINYRLGALGFMAHPELSAESPHASSGNYAILDQIAALKWVRDNISGFGGDPNNVTIFGESAGGTSVFALTATPLSKGLFHQAIQQSPWLNPVIFRHLKKETFNGASAESDGVDEANKVFGASTDKVLPKLRAMPAKAILKKLKPRWPIATDGWIFPKSPRQIYADGEQHDVPSIVGTNRDEGTMFAVVNPFGSMDDYRLMMAKLFGDDAHKVIDFYGAKSRGDLRKVAVRQITDTWFIRPSREFARAMERKKSPVWMYHFTRPVSLLLGSAHAGEIRYVFGNVQRPSPDDATLSSAMMDYWVQFATSGDPNGNDRQPWPAYTTDADTHLVFDTKIETSSGLHCKACDLLDEVTYAREKTTAASSDQ